MTDDLITFLRARLDEDAEIAADATAGPWHKIHDDDHDAMSLVAVSSEPQNGRSTNPDTYIATTLMQTGRPRVGHTGKRWHEDAEHIARHDPARVLADIDAKRLIVAYFADELAEATPLRRQSMSDSEFLRVLDAQRTLGWLALPYADHPDYREEWRP